MKKAPRVFLSTLKAGERGIVTFDPPLRPPYIPMVVSVWDKVVLVSYNAEAAGVYNPSNIADQYALVINDPKIRFAFSATKLLGRSAWAALKKRFLNPS